MTRFIPASITRALLATSLLITSLSVSALEQYVVTKPIELSNEQHLTVGTVVEVLGINEVPKSVSASGQLITFLKGNEVLTADADSFEEFVTGSNIMLTPFHYVPSKGKNAQVCATLYRTSDKARLNPKTDDLAKFIQVFNDGNRVNVNFVEPQAPLRNREVSYERYSRTNTDFCIQGLDYASTYSVKLLSGLPVIGCSDDSCKQFELDKQITAWAQTNEKPASIEVSSGQTILPTKQSAFVPVSVTNLDAVDVQLFKVDLRSINSGYYNFKALDGYDLKNFENTVGIKVGSYTIPVKVEPNTSTKINLDLSRILPADEPGLYVAVFDSEGLELGTYETRPTQWLIRSNIAVTSYHGINKTDVILSEFDSAAPISDAEITILAGNNRLLFEGRSDTNGLLSIPSKLISGKGNHAPKYLIAKRNQSEVALVEFNAQGNTLSAGQTGELKTEFRDVYLTTDRELYRAGEKVEYLSISRDIELNALVDKDFAVRLKNPEGKVVFADVVNTGNLGFVSGSIPLESTARLGQYDLQVVGMDDVVLATHKIKLQDFVPLTIETNLSVPNPWAAGQNNFFDLRSAYFSGGAAAGLKAEVQTSLIREFRHSETKWKDYYFGTNESPSNEALESYEIDALNSSGIYSGSLIIPPEKYSKSGIYSVRLKGSTFDIGGRPNTALLDVPFDTTAEYIGAKALFDGALSDGTSPSFKVVSIDRDGQQMELSNYTYKLQRVDYDFNWYYDSGWRYRRNRVGSEILFEGSSDTEILTLDTTVGWGAYELAIQNEDGFTTVVPFWAGWYGDKPINEPTELSLSAEKISPNELRVRVNAPFAGQLRLMEATGDIESVSTHDVSKGPNEIVVETSLSTEPGFHVLGTLVRPISRGQEHLPQLAIGSRWVSHLAENRVIDTDLIVETEQRSSDETNVTVKVEADLVEGRIFLVDDGIHSITRYSNANPSKFFYGPRKLSVGFLSNFGSLVRQDDSLDSYGVGGDQPTGNAATAKSEFYKTVIASSPVLVSENGVISYSFEAPHFEGRLRAVVVVAGKNGVGFGQTEITVQDPVSVDTSLPRFVGAGDKVSGKLALRFNESAERVTMTQRVGSQEVETTLIGRPGGDPVSQSISLSGLPSGRIPVELTLKYGVTESTRDYSLVVREASYPLTKMQSIKIENGRFSSGKTIEALELSDFSNTENVEVLWSLSPLPGATMSSVLNSLNRYPYGCLEQTSSVTRGLLVSADNKNSTEILDRIDTGVNRIIAKQKANGSFGYWDRNDRVELRYLPYAVDTLIHSRIYLGDTRKVDESIKSALSYLDRQFFDDAWTAMYAYGVLANSGFEVTSRARYAIDEQLPKALNASVWLGEKIDLVAAGYWLSNQIKDQRRADILSTQLLALLEESESITLSGLFDGSDDWFQPSTIRDDQDKLRYWRARSGVLIGSLSVGERNDATTRYITKAIERLSSLRYRSTLDNANLAALLSGEQSKLDNLVVKVDGTEYPVQQDRSILIDKSKASAGFELDHSADGVMYLNAEIIGGRSSNDPIDNGFEIQKVWVDKNGIAVSNNRRPWSVKQGDIFTVIVAAKPTVDHGFGNLMITDLLPTGFEIETQTGFDPFFIDNNGERVSLADFYRAEPDWSESMDDRFVANFSKSWRRGDLVAAFYQVRAVYPSEMVIPDAHAELMYRPEINGRSASTRGSINISD